MKTVPVGVARGVVEAVQFVVIFGINTTSTTREISAIWLAQSSENYKPFVSSSVNK